MKRLIFIFFGLVCVILGIIGIVTPILPTTPFLLLATYLFTKSSKRLNDLLLQNKILGKYIRNYIENKPVPLKDRFKTI